MYKRSSSRTGRGAGRENRALSVASYVIVRAIGSSAMMRRVA
jgi:hypothetical protein